MKPLRVGIYDNSFRGFDPSITHLQTPPASLEYVDFPRSYADIDACDVLIATADMARMLPPHRRRVLWLPENREFAPHPPAHVIAEFDLVLTNDMDLVAALPGRARWLSLIGTWIPAVATAPPKTRSVSMIASAKARTSGHRLRHEVAALRAIPDCDCYGAMFGKFIQTKDEALWPYRFTVVIEPAAYTCLVTEKLCDAFATQTVPLYWGPPDLKPLEDLGFDLAGIRQWNALEDLRNDLVLVAVEGEAIFARLATSISRNQSVARELYCTEVLLERSLREHFSL